MNIRKQTDKSAKLLFLHKQGKASCSQGLYVRYCVQTSSKRCARTTRCADRAESQSPPPLFFLIFFLFLEFKPPRSMEFKGSRVCNTTHEDCMREQCEFPPCHGRWACQTVHWQQVLRGSQTINITPRRPCLHPAKCNFSCNTLSYMPTHYVFQPKSSKVKQRR